MRAKLDCGSAIQIGNFAGAEICSGGCLVAYRDAPHKIMMISVAHGLLTKNAAPGDPVIVANNPSQKIGQLINWATIAGEITADVALVWVDPSKVSASNSALGPLRGANRDAGVSTGARLYKTGPGTDGRTTVIQVNQNVTIQNLSGNGWQIAIPVTYTNQFVCESAISFEGASGAAVVDDNNNVIGIAVVIQTLTADDGTVASRTVITPIANILDHPDLGGNLVVVT